MKKLKLVSIVCALAAVVYSFATAPSQARPAADLAPVTMDGFCSVGGNVHYGQHVPSGL
jgi:hypothetical protein